MKKLNLMIVFAFCLSGMAVGDTMPGNPYPVSINLNSEHREILLCAFPEESEVRDYFFDRSSSLLSDEDSKDLYSLLNDGEKYSSDITKDMAPALKVQGIIGKVMALLDAKDNARRLSYGPKKIISSTVQIITEKLNAEFPCYLVTVRRTRETASFQQWVAWAIAVCDPAHFSL